MEQGFVFVHAAARLLANPAGETGTKLRQRFDGLLAAMRRHRHRVDDHGVALDHFRKVASSYRPGLFHTADMADLPRTNNALEQLFGVDPTRWKALRRSLDRERQARTARTRFRRDPDAYLNALEQQAQQLALPS